jgi:hypothetical protein
MQEFMQQHKNSFVVVFFKWRYLVAICFAAMIMLLNGCKKNVAPGLNTEDLLQQYFEQNVLNRDFVVELAVDTSHDLTARYDGYVFRLTKNTYFDGPITAVKASATYTGTWSSNEDYSQLLINITQPSVPDGFSFINRSWRFTRKAFPLMELAPWGSSDPKVLHMLRQ